jgi:hypothetical protein
VFAQAKVIAPAAEPRNYFYAFKKIKTLIFINLYIPFSFCLDLTFRVNKK